MNINRPSLILILFVVLSIPDTNGQRSNSQTNCKVEFEVGSIPKQIRKAIKKDYHSRITLANPDENFQSTDVIGKKKLKERRLVLWAKCDNDFYLVYEHGGYGYHRHAILVTQSGKDLFVKRNVGLGKSAKTIEEVKEAVNLETVVSFDHF